MFLKNRIAHLSDLGNWLSSNSEEIIHIKRIAESKNGWFTQNFIDLSIKNIVDEFLDEKKLTNWVNHYHIDDNIIPKTIGIVMAGNIPLVGFHDFLCAFICGHKQKIKLSSKDEILMKSCIEFLWSKDENYKEFIRIEERLNDCDAYIATGSNNTSRYFEQYFGKYPNIIRKNRTSVAILNGKEKEKELELLSNDIHLFFGLGCRNVTKLFVPKDFDFVRLLDSFNSFQYFDDNQKYKNNYDFQLSLLLLNKQYYMTDGVTLLHENESAFAPISVLNYEYYENKENLLKNLTDNDSIQCIVGENHTKFGAAQSPSLFDYADGIDTMQFLLSLDN